MHWPWPTSYILSMLINILQKLKKILTTALVSDREGKKSNRQLSNLIIRHERLQTKSFCPPTLKLIFNKQNLNIKKQSNFLVSHISSSNIINITRSLSTKQYLMRLKQKCFCLFYPIFYRFNSSAAF